MPTVKSIAILDFSARLRTLRPRCASSEGGDLLRPPLATEYSMTRPNPAFLASLLEKLLKVEVATSLGAIAGLSRFSRNFDIFASQVNFDQ